MFESDCETERRQAEKVHGSLHRLVQKLQNSGTPTPSELSAHIMKSGNRATLLFLWMASNAVRQKYEHAGKLHVAVALQMHCAAIERAYQYKTKGLLSRRIKEIVDSGRRIQEFYDEPKGKRISQHQSRSICADADMLLCGDGAIRLDFGITAWVCQQSDLRFRWTEQGMRRLFYLAECWSAYSQCDFTWEDRTIGLATFPAHAELCAG